MGKKSKIAIWELESTNSKNKMREEVIKRARSWIEERQKQMGESGFQAKCLGKPHTI